MDAFILDKAQLAAITHYVHASFSLAGMLRDKVQSLDPKKEEIMVDRLRSILRDVAGARVIARALHDDYSGDGLGSMESRSNGPTRDSDSGPQTESPQVSGEPENLDAGL